MKPLVSEANIDILHFVNFLYGAVIDVQEYRSLMSSSPYRRVAVEIENWQFSYGTSYWHTVHGIKRFAASKFMGVCLQILFTNIVFNDLFKWRVHVVQGVVQFTPLQFTVTLAIYIHLHLWVQCTLCTVQLVHRHRE